MSLFSCTRVLPLNDPTAGGAPYCSGNASIYGDFGGQPFPSEGPSVLSSAPLVSLASLLGPAGFGSTDPCPVPPDTTRITLGDGVSLPDFRGAHGGCELTWQQRGWDVGVQLGLSLQFELPFLDQVVTLVQATHLPSAHGVVFIEDAGDGEHSAIYWAQGNALYWVNEYHSASRAFELLGSAATTSP
ncbi:MAG: hypothetical protein ACRDX8_04400 [Acidimicrobiales bacterium]